MDKTSQTYSTLNFNLIFNIRLKYNIDIVGLSIGKYIYTVKKSFIMMINLI
mgnify:CR=1 FL=1